MNNQDCGCGGTPDAQPKPPQPYMLVAQYIGESGDVVGIHGFNYGSLETGTMVQIWNYDLVGMPGQWRQVEGMPEW